MTKKKRNFVRFLTFILLSTFIFAMSAETFAQKKPKKKARKIARQANDLFNQRKYTEAIVKYAEALSISPRFPNARLFKGNAHYRQEQYDLAILELNLALEQGADPRKVYPLRMESYAAQGKFDLAMNDARDALKFEKSNPYYNGFLGKMSVLNQNYDMGIIYLENAVNGKTQDPNVFYYLALAYNGKENYEMQEKFADMALKRGTPFAANSWFLSADASQRTRKYQKAAQSYKNAINAYQNLINTNRGDAKTEDYLYQSHANLADVYRNLNLFEEAVKSAKNGLSIKNFDENLHISLAWYYSLAGNRESALVAGKRAIEVAPNQYMAYTNLCRAYNDEAEYLYKNDEVNKSVPIFNNAIESCKKALDLEPNDGETNYYLGRAYYYLDNENLSQTYYKKSVKGLTRFTQNNPDYSDGFYLLGNAYFAIKDKDNAIIAYKECLRITPRFALVRHNLGFVYAQKGEMDKAREQYDVLKTLDDDLANRLLKVIK